MKPANHCVCPFSYFPGLVRQEVDLAGYRLAVYPKHGALSWGKKVYRPWLHGVRWKVDLQKYTEQNLKYSYMYFNIVSIKFYLMHSLLSIHVHVYPKVEAV